MEVKEFVEDQVPVKRKVVYISDMCAYKDCEKVFEMASETVRYFCSKECRLMSRGGKKGEKLHSDTKN